MSVFHFSSSTRGGAAIAARRLHGSLHQFGVNSTFWYADRQNNKLDDTFKRLEFMGPRNSARWFLAMVLYHVFRRVGLNYYLSGRPGHLEQFSYSHLPYRTPFNFAFSKPDVVHLHWIAAGFDYPSFFGSIPDNHPIVWTLHDMNPFTGGCHYAWGCRKYETQCHTCPQLNHRRSENDLSHRNFSVRLRALRNKKLHIVADSHWLETEARRSRLLSQADSFRTIHYGLDSELFAPRRKHQCRERLGINSQAFVLGFGADSIRNRRKGLAELVEALESLPPEEDIVLLTFGRTHELRIEAPFRHVSLGHIESEELLAIVYSACDVFAIPSLHEAFGQTALEAMSCGTPVVGAHTGGIPDIVRPGETGLLAEPGSSSDLAEKIAWMLRHPDERIAMGNTARRVAETEFALSVQAEQYVQLYREVLAP